ncbi:MAG: hypothetical protein WCW16_00950 [Candidatus Magasanikbacteria bacterium]
MKKILLYSVCTLLFVGAGCSNTVQDNSNIPSKPADTPNQETTSTDNQDTDNQQQIALTANALGDATVKFEWNVPTNLESEEGYRIVYGTDSNPTFPSLWWFERGPTHREKVWSGLPLGVAHFRVCAVVDDACGEYSNDVEVDIK